MFGFTWLTLKQIREAIRQGRLDEAARLLESPSIRQHRQAGELLTQLARAFVEQGERSLAQEETERAWSYLQAAERLGLADKSFEKLRRDLVSFEMAQLRALLSAGELSRADALRLQLRAREVRSPELLVLEEGLQSWTRAMEWAEQGEFTMALDDLERTRRLLGVNERLDAQHLEWLEAGAALPELLAQLQQAATREDWADVVERAEEVIRLAPNHPEARALRSRAWRSTEPPTLALGNPTDNATTDALGPRFFLWIDGVGGFLVCLSPRLTLGQAGPTARVDIPLFADVSRLHAGLYRDAEGYSLEAMRPVLVNDRSVSRTPLKHNDEITLGKSCRLRFCLPIPASHSARLELVSGHRLPSGVDGVLLMAETLILGDRGGHVKLDGEDDAVILFRHKDGLGLRHDGSFQVNGTTEKGRVLLPASAVVVGERFSFAIEPAT
jgi:tetratricopeptide (TPR) repeat protein